MNAVDWSIFAGQSGGDLFEEFCVDLLRAQGYEAERSSKGPDSGKDIWIYDKPKSESLIQPKVICIAECKSRVSGKRRAISLRDLNRTGWNVLENTDIHCLRLYTTHKFNDDAIRCFRNINNKNDINISWIDGDDLSNQIVDHPSIWKQYFKCNPPSKPEKSKVIRIDEVKKSPFLNDISINSISFQIMQPWSGTISLVVGEEVFERKEINSAGHYTIAFNDRNLQIDSSQSFLRLVGYDSDSSSSQDIPIQNNSNVKKIARLDSKFSDPDGNCEILLTNLRRNINCHLEGIAGSGKSRFLKEIRQKIQHESLYIEYVNNNKKNSLFDALIRSIFGASCESLSLLSQDIISHIGLALGLDQEVLSVLSYSLSELSCETRREINNQEIAQSISTALPRNLKVIIIDNIQWMSDFDRLILSEVLKKKSKLCCIFASRLGSDLEYSNSQEVVNLFDKSHLFELKIDGFAMANRIEEFINITSFNGDTNNLLQRLASGLSFQEFMSTLKALRQLGVVNVYNSGSIEIIKQIPSAKLGDYNTLQKIIVSSKLDKNLKKLCSESIQIASIFGYRFPAEFIIFCLGEDAINALDQLLLREIIVLEEYEGLYGPSYIFDHVLTRNSIYESIGGATKTRLHDKAAEFILNWDKYISGRQYYDAAYHKQYAKKTRDSIALWDKGVENFMSRHRINEAQEGLIQCLNLYSHLHIDSKQYHDIDDELRLREVFLENALLVHPEEEQWQHQIYAFIIDTKNYPNVSGYDRRLGKGLCFQACFHGFRRKQLKALEKINDSLSVLKPIKNNLAYAEALKWASNIKKNLASYDEAIDLGLESYNLYRESQNLKGQGESALELYHTYAENLEFEESKKWIHIAREHYSSYRHPGLIARTYVEEARVLSILQPNKSYTMEAHQFAINSAKRYCIGSHVGRAIMNMGIYQASQQLDIDLVHITLNRALEELKTNQNNYQKLILDFSIIILTEQKDFISEKIYSLSDRLMELCIGYESVHNIGDRRIQNMIKVMLAIGNETIINWVKNSTVVDYSLYFDIGLGDELSKKEKNNPYFSGWKCLLYY